MILFEPISFEQFQKDFLPNQAPNFEDEGQWFYFWETVVEPRRATEESAAYDFYTPFDFSLKPGEEITIPSGCRLNISKSLHVALFILPRSGAGFKCYTRLANTIGLIDGDYYKAENEGHIWIKIRNESDSKLWSVNKGQGYAQGVLLPFFLVDNDHEHEKQVRTGGLGSTTI